MLPIRGTYRLSSNTEDDGVRPHCTEHVWNADVEDYEPGKQSLRSRSSTALPLLIWVLEPHVHKHTFPFRSVPQICPMVSTVPRPSAEDAEFQAGS
jgi:hypothetical protein